MYMYCNEISITTISSFYSFMSYKSFKIIVSKIFGTRTLSLTASFHYGGKSNKRVDLYHMPCVVHLCMYAIDVP